MKNEAKYTSGPWFWADCKVYCAEILPKNNPSNLHDYHREIASCIPAGKFQAHLVEEAKANARLIAAAPELLERLKDAQAVIDRLALDGKYFDTRDNARGLQGAINEALAEAEQPKGIPCSNMNEFDKIMRGDL